MGKEKDQSEVRRGGRQRDGTQRWRESDTKSAEIKQSRAGQGEMDEWNSCVWQELGGEAGVGRWGGGLLRDNINGAYRTQRAGWATVRAWHDKCSWKKTFDISVGCHHEKLAYLTSMCRWLTDTGSESIWKWVHVLLLLLFPVLTQTESLLYVTALQETHHTGQFNHLHQTQPSAICAVLPGDHNTDTRFLWRLWSEAECQ